MANIQPRKNKEGKIIAYRIKVYKYTDELGKKHFYEKSFKPDEKWSEKKTQTELNKEVVLFEKQCKDGLTADNKQTFQNYAKYVLDLKARNGIKYRTLERYEELLTRINKGIGHFKLSELKPQHLNKLYEQLAQNGLNKNTGGRLSNKTIREHHRIIHTILAQATKEMLLPYNIADRAEPPKVKHSEAHFLTLDDIQNVLFFLKNEPIKWQVALNLLIFTGCRRGEIAGLKWDKIDFTNNSIKIDNNLLYSAKKGIYTDLPKTEQSKRTISIPAELIDLLKEYKKEQNKLRLERGTKWNYTGYILTQENGNPIHPDTLTDYCNKFTIKYNKIISKEYSNFKSLPHLNPHAFRHSQASLLIQSGKCSIVEVSKRLGHAKVSTTTDIYSHILHQKDVMLSDTLSDMILKTKTAF